MSKPFTFDRVVRMLIALAITIAVIWLTGLLYNVFASFLSRLSAFLYNGALRRIQPASSKNEKERPGGLHHHIRLHYRNRSDSLFSYPPLLLMKYTAWGR